MSTSAAAPVAAPTADTSTASALDDMFDGFDNEKGEVIPEQNFDVGVDRQPGSGTTRAKPADTVDVTNGEVAKPKAAEETVDESVATTDDDEIGEPYTIGKDGRVRGKDGKFMDKSVVDAAAAKAAEAAAAPAKKADPSPFRYRTKGETHDFEGGSVDPESGDITIKGERAGILREALNALHVRNVEHIPQIQKITERNQQLETENASLKSGVGVKETEYEAKLARLDAAILEGDETKAIEMFFKLREDMPRLQLEAKAEYYKRLAEGKQSAAPKPAAPATAAGKAEDAGRSESPVSLADEAVETVDDVADTLSIQHEYRDISAEDWQRFKARSARTPMAYIRPATAEHAKKHGVQVGESVFDHDLLNEDIKDYVSGLREQRAVAKRAQDLAIDRSRRTQPQVATPPTINSGAPAPKVAERGITSKSEWDNWLDSPGLD